jgi:hypothetical protein
LVDLGFLGDHDYCCGFDRKVFGELDSGILTVVGEHDVPDDGKDSVWRWLLQDEVGVVGYGHEHSEHRSSEDVVV